MSTMQYDSRQVYKEVVEALQKEDVEALKEADRILGEHNDKHVLLMLTPREYEQYHELLGKTSIEDEILARMTKEIG